MASVELLACSCCCRTIDIPAPITGVYTLLSSKSGSLQEIRAIQNDNSPWLAFGDTIDIYQDYRDETLIYQGFNKSQAYSLITLHFVVENLPSGKQLVLIKFKRNKSYNFNSILYIGYDNLDGSDNLNLFNTSSPIFSQYYEDTSSAIL